MPATENVPPSPGNVEAVYQKKTQLEHVLLRPDSYIGSVEMQEEFIWVYNGETERMEQRKVNFVPGLYKIFDEILVNAADNKQRDPKNMNELKVIIDKEKGFISVYNNGKGIPVVVHKEHNCYVPELIFGNLLTSSNYNDKQKKTVGGRNGFGAKLANIFSTEFIVETQDSKNGKRYYQKFSNNMGKKGTPKVTDSDKSDWTKISFKPDLEKFGMSELDDDIIALFQKRVIDIAGTTDSSLKVWMNGKRITMAKGFRSYVEKYLPAETPQVYAKINDRWEVCISVTDGHFQQVSFVNNICTIKGGRHVQLIQDQVTKAICDHIGKKHKGVNVKSHQVKNYIWIFVNCLIENPAFDSQTKDTLTTKKGNFGSKCELTETFMKDVIKGGVIQNVLEWAKFKQNKDLKKNDGKKRNRLTGIPKLDDANHAGGKNGHECTLILTEGDSAKALAVSGLSVVGRDKYGVFPLKGKVLNVREASHKSIMGNAEISNLKQIIGLQAGKTYEDTKSLRYGHVMIMTDQDHDGSHIKGLLINLFATFWPSLLKMPGFLTEFITPIVKVTKGKQCHSFYTLPEYLNWKENHNDGKGWKIKYYKGLGTSTAKEAKEYFSALARHKIDFAYQGPEDDANIDMAFSKKCANQRKQWIAEYDGHSFLDQDVDSIGYSEFINKELILFSIASNLRAIPSIMDGLKPGQRKVLYSCFKRKLTKEIKVAQLAGYVSEHSAYHHGEASLTATICNLAQRYVGSNNINLLLPNGQFGTRHQGGKDAASARYIFTNLNPITRTIFHEHDDAILEPLNDDGQLIEPAWYVPILPMVLVNGAAGIGTGWSTNIPNYNPRDLVACLKQLIKGEEPAHIMPWYKGYVGGIVNAGPQKFHADGKMEQLDDITFRISELPIESWSQDYKIFLETLIEKGVLKEIREYHTDNTVEFVVLFSSPEAVAQADSGDGLFRFFKLRGSLCTTNMVLFDHEGKIRKYETELEILQEFFDVRLKHYHVRKEYLVDKLETELLKLSNKVRFILAVIKDEIKIRNVKKAVIIQQLREQKYDPMPKKTTKKAAEDEDEEDEEEEDQEKENEDVSASDYDYLLSMPLWNLTKEKVDALKADKEAKEAELVILKETTPETMWETDLDNFLAVLEELEELELKGDQQDAAMIKKSKNKAKRAKKYEDDDEDYGVKKPKKKPAKVENELQLPTVAIRTIEPKHIEEKVPRPRKEKMQKTIGELGEEAGDENSYDFESGVLTERGKAKGKGTRKLKPAIGKKKAQLSASITADDLDISDLDDADDLDKDEVEVPKPRSKPKRAMAAKKSYVEIDDDEEEAESEDEIRDVSEDDGSDYEEAPKPKPAVKKPRAATKPKVAPKAVSKKPAEKQIEESKPEPVDEDSDDDGAVLSLAERVQARLKGALDGDGDDSVKSKAKTKAVPAKAKKTETHKRVRAMKSETPERAKKTISKKADLQEEAIPSPAPAQKQKKQRVQKGVAKSKRAPAKKKLVESEDDEGSDFGTNVAESPVVPRARPARQRNAVSYVEKSESESEPEYDDEDDSDFEG